MPKYLLACDCGNQVPVDIGQAGGRVTCSCGAQLDVPPLRKMRHLPLSEEGEERVTAGWGTGHGIFTASLILAVALAAVNLWSWWTQPKVPRFDPVAHGRAVDEHLKTLTPADAWRGWVEYYRPLGERGLPVFEPYNRAEVERQIAHRQFLRRILWIVVGICIAIAAAVALWPRSAATRSSARRA